jgi:hypothetical protein
MYCREQALAVANQAIDRAGAAFAGFERTAARADPLPEAMPIVSDCTRDPLPDSRLRYPAGRSRTP